MNKFTLQQLLAVLGLFLFLSCQIDRQPKKTDNGAKIRVSLQKRIVTDQKNSLTKINEVQYWNPNETAIIICDMWDEHWCGNATKRVGELAPQINDVVSIARKKGVLIVHAPSDCMEYYSSYNGRKQAQKYIDTTAITISGSDKLNTEKGAIWPIDDSNGGCDDSISREHKAWKKQIDAIPISDNDIISDSGAELLGIFRHVGIKNVILMGVHTNMCIMHRSFGLRNMMRFGFNTVLMRDMTDAMYDPTQKPYVSHFDGVKLIVNYIETYVAPTITSSTFTHKKPFQFVKNQVQSN